MSSKNNLVKTVLAAVFLALALVLPLLTGQLRQIGNALCPMHIPVLLCGFICGPWYGLAIGFTAPLLRFLIFSAPPIMPVGIAMAFELAAYGLVAGLMYQTLQKNKGNIYVSLISAMVSGRIVWGIVLTVLYGFGKAEFGFAAFIAGAFINAIPGIIIQIILVPALIITFKKANENKGFLM